MRRLNSKTTAASLALVGLVCLSRPAAAQERNFGEAVQFVVSGDRLAGVFWADAETDADGTTETAGLTITTRTDVESSSLKFASFGNDQAAGPSSIPRLGFDVFVIPHLSIGGSLMSINDSDNSESRTRLSANANAVNVRTETESSRSAVVFAPRVGYGTELVDHLGLWVRGGITYGTETSEVDEVNFDDSGDPTETNTETTVSVLQLSLEAMLLIIPFQHFGIGMGAFIDIPLTGSIEIESTGPDTVTSAEGDVTLLTLGLTTNLVGWL